MVAASSLMKHVDIPLIFCLNTYYKIYKKVYITVISIQLTTTFSKSSDSYI